MQNVSEVMASVDGFKEELIGSINEIGSKYGLIPAVLIHVLSEIVAEARANEYRNIVESLIQKESESTDSNIQSATDIQEGQESE